MAHKFTQPKIFYLAFFTSMCERFGFYVLSYLLVLFGKSIFHLTDNEAFTLFAIFTSLAFITPVVGGYLADNFFGIRRTLLLGLALEGAGLFCLATPGNHLFVLGLSLIVLGVGFFKTGPTNLLARSYKDQDPRIDSGFTLLYMGINIGSFSSSLCAAAIQRYFGWHAAFFIAGAILCTSFLWYAFLRSSAGSVDSKPGKHKLAMKSIIQLIAGTALTCALFAFLINHSTIAYAFFSLSTLLLLLFFLFEILKSKRTDKLRIIACILLISMGMVFFVLYFQAYTSITLFVRRCIMRTIWNIHIPTVTFLMLNSLWILVLSPILAVVYNMLSRHKMNPAITTKFPIGILFISLCFFSLAYSVGFANAQGLISSLWIVLAFALFSLGELLISALGVAMVTHISPKHLYGIMMGAWYLASALAASISGKLANLASVPDTLHNQLAILHIYQHTFLEIGMIGAVAAAIAFAAAPYIRKIAQLS